MKVKLDINNKIDCSFSQKKLKSIVVQTLNQFDFVKSHTGNFYFSIAFIESAEIREINKKYRKKNSVTDVLSFANYDKLKDRFKEIVEKNKEKDIFVGEIILCCDDIKEYAKHKERSFEGELATVVIHGTLHLLGFSHSKEMFEIQDRIVDSL